MSRGFLIIIIAALLYLPSLALAGDDTSPADKKQDLGQEAVSAQPAGTPGEEAAKEEELLKQAQEQGLIGDFEGKVNRVVTADIIEVNGIRMHLLGVVAPQKGGSKKKLQECFSTEAMDYIESLIKDKTVTYSYDRVFGRHDLKGKRHAYVYFDGKLVNAGMIEKGQGFAQRSGQYAHKEQFLELESDSRLHNRGLWHRCPVECDRSRECVTKNW